MSIQDSFLFEDDFTDTDWKEDILQSRTDAISFDSSQCHVAIIVPFAQYKAAVRFILGYSWVDENHYLRREPTAFHPVWPWLFARSIPNITFSSATGKDTAQWEHAVPFAVYVWARIEIEFGEVAYQVLRDDEVDTSSVRELARYIEENPQEYSELFQIDGGQLKAYAPGVATVNGNPYVAAPYILARTEKSAFDLVWHQVPKEFLYNTTGRAPKLAAIQKKVNNDTFLGRPAGTLLCESVKAVKHSMPVATDVFDGLAFYYDVTFEMKEFDPTPGDPTATVGGSVVRGWNNLPGSRDTGSSGNTAFGWYYFTDDGTATGKPQFDNYAFASAFTHWSL